MLLLSFDCLFELVILGFYSWWLVCVGFIPILWLIGCLILCFLTWGVWGD